MMWIRSRKELEEVLEKFPYEKQLWHSRNPWDKLEALYFLELMGYAFTPRLICRLLREIDEKVCREGGYA
jgi:hypothetical protein